MNDQQQKHLTTVPDSAVGIVKRAYERNGGRANAIKAMCLHCVGYTRNDVRNCTSGTCPLHPWRPYQPKPDGSLSTDLQDDEFDPDLDGDPADLENEDDDEL